MLNEKETYEFYKNHLSNFKTVLKDTNNNLVTANDCDYNCMSYALGVFDEWLEIDSFRCTFLKEEEVLNDVFCDCCNELEERFAVRRLSGPAASLEANERLIAFRIGYDDFHFVRQNSDGSWTHKPGWDYIREMSEGELFDDSWCENSRCYPYISEIAFFAVKI